jgi:hypothetical protein
VATVYLSNAGLDQVTAAQEEFEYAGRSTP